MSWDVTHDEIRRLCGYISDDQTVANYFGCSRELVEYVRSNMPKPARNHSGEQSYGGLRASSGLEQERALTQDAIGGSQRLNERLHSLFRKWERVNGFQEGAAQILLPAGWSEQRKVEAA